MSHHDPQPASFTTRPTITARRGVVTAGHYLASQVGLEVLARGGNAIDAGVATAFALTLLKPQECGIGGECPILIYHPAASRGGPDERAGGARRPNPFVISGQGAAPRNMTIARVRELGLNDIPGKGLVAAAVPATVGGLITALIEAGTLGLAETLGPVVELARDGFAVYPALRVQLAAFEQRLGGWPSSAEVFLDGGVPDVGPIVRFPMWAASRTRLLDAEAGHGSEGRASSLRSALDVFYRGSMADEIERFVAPARTFGTSDLGSGGEPPAFLAAEDLAAHRSTIETPTSFRYRGLDVFKTPPWGQGPVFLQQLALLAGDDIASLGHNSPEYLHLVVEASKLAFADREALYGDPNFVDVPLDRLRSPEYNRERRALIDPRAGLTRAPARPGRARRHPPVVGRRQGRRRHHPRRRHRCRRQPLHRDAVGRLAAVEPGHSHPRLPAGYAPPAVQPRRGPPERASGYWTTRSEVDPQLHERTSGVYLRADPADMAVVDGDDLQARLDLIALRLREWKAIASS